MVVRRLAYFGRSVWRTVLPLWLRLLVHRRLYPSAERFVANALGKPRAPYAAGDIVVSGLIAEGKGVSQAARLTVCGLNALGLRPVAHDIRPSLEAPGRGRISYPSKVKGGVWLLHVNAPEALQALAAHRPDEWRDRFRIGYWAWELPTLPSSWVEASFAFDELWVPSRFIADALAASGVDTRVRVIPHPVALERPTGRPTRARFGLPEGDVVVLAMGDLHSSAARKNLLGAIDIYRRAWPTPLSGIRLIVKTQSDTAHPRFREEAAEVMGGRGDIKLVSETLSIEDTHNLIASVNILLSPHRAEGFGLTLAEAFLLDVAVLATGWSGSMEFMDGVPGGLIDYNLVPVDDPYGVYLPGDVWADPDLEDGARKLRALAESLELRRSNIDHGRRAIEGALQAWAVDGPVAILLRPLRAE